MHVKYFLIPLLILFMSSCTNKKNDPVSNDDNSGSELLFIGTYTQKEGHVDGKADGIYLAELNSQSGEISVIDTISEISNPSYLTVHPNGKYMYAVSELAGAEPLGKVVAYQINKSKKQAEILNELSTSGNAPCHLSVDSNSGHLYVVNYMGGIINYKIKADGSLTENPQVVNYHGGIEGSIRQESPHPHMVQSDRKTVYVTDLGDNSLLSYQSGNNGELTRTGRAEMLPESGPRHFAVHPENDKLYIINELSNTIEVFQKMTKSSDMKRIQNILAHNGFEEESGRYGSAIKIHKNGKFLYVGIRGPHQSRDNAIHLFHIDNATGLLDYQDKIYTKGDVPRDFEIDPSGKFLLVANQNSDNIVTFHIDQEDGTLENSAFSAFVKTPVCIKFVNK